MTDANQSADKDHVGIAGWLLFYVITTIVGILWTAIDPAYLVSNVHPVENYLVGLVITSNAIGLYLIFRVRKPITQTYHIWLNLLWAGFSAFGIILLGLSSGWPVVIVMLIWAFYWIGSKRVRNTYRGDTAMPSG
jgi:hypothetical protein